MRHYISKRILFPGILFALLTQSLWAKIAKNKVYQLEKKAFECTEKSHETVVIVKEKNLINKEAEEIDHILETTSHEMHCDKELIPTSQCENTKNNTIIHEKAIEKTIEKDGICKAIHYIKKTISKNPEFSFCLTNASGTVLYSSYDKENNFLTLPFESIHTLYDIQHEQWIAHFTHGSLYYSHVKRIMIHNQTYFLISGFLSYDSIIHNEYVYQRINTIAKNNSIESVTSLINSHTHPFETFHDFTLSLLNPEDVKDYIQDMSLLSEDMKKSFLNIDDIYTICHDEYNFTKAITKKKITIENKPFYIIITSMGEFTPAQLHHYVESQKNIYTKMTKQKLLESIHYNNNMIHDTFMYHIILNKQGEILSESTKISNIPHFSQNILESIDSKSHYVHILDNENNTLYVLSHASFFIEGEKYILCVGLIERHNYQSANIIQHNLTKHLHDHPVESLYELFNENHTLYKQKNIFIGIYTYDGICLISNDTSINKPWEKCNSRLPFKKMEKLSLTGGGTITIPPIKNMHHVIISSNIKEETPFIIKKQKKHTPYSSNESDIFCIVCF
jgi:hypothetical protein